MYKVNFNHLHYFLTIAREGTIVKASKKLHITQPALSHQLKNFELDLGKKLFDRKGRRLVLNDDGRQVLEYGEKIFRQSDEMLEVLKSENPIVSRTLRVGVISWLPSESIYEFLKPLLFSSHIQIQVFQKDLDSLLEEVKSEKLDIILCDSPYSGRSKKLTGKKISSEEIHCVTAYDEKVKGKFPQSINHKRLITFSEASELTDHVDGFLKDNQLNVNLLGQFTDTSLISFSVEKGGVISFLPKTITKRGIKEKTLKKIGVLQGVEFSIWAIYRKDEKKKGLVHSLVDVKKRKLS
ncbi:MAG: LysR family transcriptional activator of nhaA [Bacteriovoracaceae bacterium]|jgi:LysR family transcriptional activator of nhaA